eukprot:Selendium_serpulae@DN6117_c1_g1_i1.p1
MHMRFNAALFIFSFFGLEFTAPRFAASQYQYPYAEPQYPYPESSSYRLPLLSGLINGNVRNNPPHVQHNRNNPPHAQHNQPSNPQGAQNTASLVQRGFVGMMNFLVNNQDTFEDLIAAQPPNSMLRKPEDTSAADPAAPPDRQDERGKHRSRRKACSPADPDCSGPPTSHPLQSAVRFGDPSESHPPDTKYVEQHISLDLDNKPGATDHSHWATAADSIRFEDDDEEAVVAPHRLIEKFGLFPAESVRLDNYGFA